MRSLPPANYAALPKLGAPAGYICVTRDVDSDLFRIDGTDHPARLVDAVFAEAAGTEVEVMDRVAGETVYGTDEWIEIRFEGGSAYIHSTLVAEAG